MVRRLTARKKLVDEESLRQSSGLFCGDVSPGHDEIRRYLSSETPRPRFADDFVVSFQFREDADHFQQRVREQFAEFGLELAEEKTRRILFGRFAEVTCLRHGLGRPETFEFLGSSMSVGRIEQGDLL
jgi:hypothetical protein